MKKNRCKLFFLVIRTEKKMGVPDLGLGRMERGERMEELELSALLRRLAPALGERCRQGGFELLLEGPPGGDPESGFEAILVRADPGGIERILINLMDNACKYASSKGKRQIHLFWKRGEGGAVLGVRDHGPGPLPPVGPPDERRLAAVRRDAQGCFFKLAWERGRLARKGWPEGMRSPSFTTEGTEDTEDTEDTKTERSWVWEMMDTFLLSGYSSRGLVFSVVSVVKRGERLQ
jgi:hypothetical protein